METPPEGLSPTSPLSRAGGIVGRAFRLPPHSFAVHGEALPANGGWAARTGRFAAREDF